MFSIREGKATRLDDKLLKNVMKNTGINQFSWHCFRKTFSAHLHQLGEESDVIEACLNHTLKSKMGVSGAYNFANYSKKNGQLNTKMVRHCGGSCWKRLSGFMNNLMS